MNLAFPPYSDQYFMDECKVERTEEHRFYLRYYCNVEMVELDGFFLPDTQIERKTLANIAILCDLLILVLFMFNIVFLDKQIRRERYRIDLEHLQMTDFTVRIKNLPPASNYDNDLAQLKAQLSIHIDKVLKMEAPQVFESMRNSQVGNSEIVNIHFARKDFSIYNNLIEIEQLTMQG